MKENGLRYSLLLEFYGELLSERQRELVDYYYNDDLSLAEISELTGITRQGVRDGIKKAEAILANYESSLGMYAQYTKRGEIGQKAHSLVSALSEKYNIEHSDALLCELTKLIETLQQ